MSSRIDHKDLLWSLLVALFGCAILFLSTPHGIGLSPDSVAYIRSSRTLLEQGGQGGINAHWPPGYPLLLALFTIPQGDYLFAARLVGMLCFGLNLFLFGMLLRKSGWNAAIAALLSGLLLFDADFINIHLMAWSEPAFLAMLQSGLLLLLSYDESPSRKTLFALAAVLGAATFLRYAGVAFIAGVAGIILLRDVVKTRDAAFLQRCLPALQLSLIALVPIALWAVYSATSGGAHGGIRSLVLHPISESNWKSAEFTIGNWFGGITAAFAVIALIAAAALLRFRAMPVNARRLLTYTVGLGLVYAGFLLVSLLYFDAYIPLDNRILSPLKLFSYLSILASMHAIVPRWQVLGVAIFTLFALTLNYSESRVALSNSSRSGLGFASKDMQDQPILAHIRQHHIVTDATNSTELFLLYLKQDVPLLPMIYDPTTTLPNLDAPRALANLARAGKTVVIFSRMTWRAYLPQARQLIDVGFTRVVYSGPDGVILQHP
jgi:hypothetical protein